MGINSPALRPYPITADLIANPRVKIIAESMDGYAAQLDNLRFIVSVATEMDGRRWLHASVSRMDHRLPDYDDMMMLKKICIGINKTALQVFPPKNKHINIAGQFGIEVLHLWHCLDGDVTPDFTRGGNSI